MRPVSLHLPLPELTFSSLLCAGPVVTIFVYEDDQWEQTCELIDSTSEHALTGSIFSYDRQVLSVATDLLRNSAGNLYLNEKVRCPIRPYALPLADWQSLLSSQTTGAQVGQQPFGGTRGSGTQTTRAERSCTLFGSSRLGASRTTLDSSPPSSLTLPTLPSRRSPLYHHELLSSKVRTTKESAQCKREKRLGTEKERGEAEVLWQRPLRSVVVRPMRTRTAEGVVEDVSPFLE